MPDPVKPKPGAKGKGKVGVGLKKKVGPLPLWAWVAILGGAAAGYWFLIRGRSADGGGDTGGPEIVSGSGAGGYNPQDAAAAGAPAENGALAGQIDPATLQALQDQLGAQVGDIRGHVTELEDAFAQAGFTENADKSWNAPDMGGGGQSFDDLVAAVVDALGGVQNSPNAPSSSPGGVKWGGNVFTTKAALGRELAAHGVNYGDWARRHPAAAKSLTGPAPPPKKHKAPSKAPVHKTPPPKHKAPPTRKAPRKPPPKRKVIHKQKAPVKRHR